MSRPIRNWLVIKLLTDEPKLYGLGDASPMENENEVKSIIKAWIDKYLKDRDPLESEVLWANLYNDPHARGGRLATTALSGIDIALWDLKGKILKNPIVAEKPKIEVKIIGPQAAQPNPKIPKILPAKLIPKDFSFLILLFK